MKINNILVAGQYEEVFQKHIPPTTSQNFRFEAIDEITLEDMDWADAYVGSAPASRFDLSKLQWVHSFNAGVNNYLAIDGWQENNVVLTRTICTFGQRISEYCLSYILRDLQHQKYFEELQEEKKWVRNPPIRLKDQTIVVFGTGEIGQEVARNFTHFGMAVYGVSQSGAQKEYFQKVVTTSSAATILPEADWVLSTLPLTDETKEFFNSELVSHFNNAAFINVGRGATVDEDALINALDSGKIRKAVLDVVTIEPLPEDSPLWVREDITITPHISAITDLDEAVICFFDTMKKIQQNEALPNKVDVSKGY
ncbi:MAG TPA: D-2-hydroxyacid dehydrogenase [Bacillales bacterium]|nr:D-2-hydroxyacid dehydrogenase [Bacillales bacterium]